MTRSFIGFIAILLMAGCFYSPISEAATALASQSERANPTKILQEAKLFFVRSKSTFFKPASLEQELLNREIVQDWGLVFTRDEADAELIIEVDRKRFTNAFVYSVINPKTRVSLIGGKIGSLGGSVEKQIGDDFIKKMQKFRSAQPAK